jgi:hypothetical protein
MSKRYWNPAKLPTPNEPVDERPPDWEARAIRAIQMYNACRAKTRMGKKGSLKFTDDVKECMWGLVRMCDEMEVEVMGWIYAVHAALSWRAPAGQTNLFKRGFKKHYDKIPDWEHAHISNTVQATRSPREFVPIHHLDATGAEVAKMRYAQRGAHSLCLINIDITYGFHSDSKICPNCPLKKECMIQTDRLAASLAL